MGQHQCFRHGDLRPGMIEPPRPPFQRAKTRACGERARLTNVLAKVSLQRLGGDARMAGDVNLVLTTSTARLLPFDG